MKSILVATDLSARADRALIRALNLAKTYQAKLTILHVIDEDSPKSFHNELSKLAKKEIFSAIEGKTKNVDYKIEIVTGIPHVKILEATLKTKADLVILGLHRHINKTNSMIGKVIERVVKNSLKPVLVVKDRSESDYKKILVAFDFNHHSKNSLKLALHLFSDAKFTLMHSYYMPYLGALNESAPAIENEYHQNMEGEMNKVVKEVTNDLAKNAKFKIKNKLEKGSVFDVVTKEIFSTQPQLLVIGTHGRSGISKMFSLNVTESFLIDPPCDILIAI